MHPLVISRHFAVRTLKVTTVLAQWARMDQRKGFRRCELEYSHGPVYYPQCWRFSAVLCFVLQPKTIGQLYYIHLHLRLLEAFATCKPNVILEMKLTSIDYSHQGAEDSKSLWLQTLGNQLINCSSCTSYANRKVTDCIYSNCSMRYWVSRECAHGIDCHYQLGVLSFTLMGCITQSGWLWFQSRCYLFDVLVVVCPLLLKGGVIGFTKQCLACGCCFSNARPTPSSCVQLWGLSQGFNW